MKIVFIILTLTVMLFGGIGLNHLHQHYCWNENAIDRYHRFWDDPDQYDVWFMGFSHTYYAVQPMKLWEDYGITAYDISTPSSTIPMTYWTLMCALEKGTPEVVFIDTYHIDLDKYTVDMREKVHLCLDVNANVLVDHSDNEKVYQ